MVLLLRNPPTWRSLAALSFWFGVCLFVMGSVITFAPGAEVAPAAMTAMFLLPGLLLSRTYRIAAAVLVLLLALFAWGGYQRGKTYQQHLRERQREDLLEQQGEVVGRERACLMDWNAIDWSAIHRGCRHGPPSGGLSSC